MLKDFLSRSIEYAKGVGPARGELLNKELNVFTFKDILSHYPYRYIDRSSFSSVKDISEEGLYVQLVGKIISIQFHGDKKRTRMVALFADKTGTVELVWFRGIKWISDKVQSGSEYVIFGRVTSFNKRFNIAHPELELLTEFKKTPREKYQPLYSSTEKMKSKGLDTRGIQKIIKGILSHPELSIPETIPGWLLQRLQLLPRRNSVVEIHSPKSLRSLENARYRLKFEELLQIQLHLISIRNHRKKNIPGHKFSKVGKLFYKFFEENLPFNLTNAQKRVIKEIRADIGSGKQMNRLLQGDVGSGKTLVALMAALIAADNGFQAAIMAPTEILAQQHFNTIMKFLSGIDVSTALLTGSTKPAQRRTTLNKLETGEINILVGTHALIEDKVVFHKLGLAIVDEQHKFGVEQRARLKAKNKIPPHILVMTATPIPRTLAMTLYGDLDYSVIDELPPGRKPVKTVHFYDEKRNTLFDFVKEQVSLGRQAYFVYPLIEESEKLDLKDLMDGFESISRTFPLPKYAVSIVHGKMPSETKEYEMNRFVKGETDIMVSTTVIEVGVDVPNATIMVIESAQRFGLSQLHQLRGRVGRGAEKSWCILMTDYNLSADAGKRIATMTSSNDGFEIAEVDLSLRGPGDIQGTRQSGLPELKIADLVEDEKILKDARDIALHVLDKDPALSHPANFLLKSSLKEKFGDKNYASVG